MGQTAGEYHEESIAMLMAGSGSDGKRPYQLRERIEKLIKAERAVTVIADMMYRDPHQFGTRPCETCYQISVLTGISFGCIRASREAKKPTRPT